MDVYALPYSDATVSGWHDVHHPRPSLVHRPFFAQLGKQPHNDQLDGAEEQMLVDVLIAEQLQRGLDVLPHQLDIRRREEAAPYRLWHGSDNGRRARALDLVDLVGCGRQARGGEGVVGKDRTANGLQQGRKVGWPKELGADLRGEQPGAGG